MTTITDADRAMARAWNAEHGGCCEVQLAQAFAAVRKQALEDAARAFKSAQYSPAPYTDGMKALRRLMDDPA